MMPEEYAEYDVEPESEVVAPPPFTPAVKSWSWSPAMMMWAAGGALALGFGVWFLMSYSGAKAQALAALEGAAS